MADSTISIPVSELRRVGGEFKAASQQTTDTLTRLSRAVNGLEPQWEGAAKQRFYQEYRQWEVGLRQFIQLLDTAGQRLETMANEVSEADRAGANRINHIGTSR